MFDQLDSDVLVDGLDGREQCGDEDATHVGTDDANGEVAHGEIRIHTHDIKDEKAAHNAYRNELACDRLRPLFLDFVAV